MSMPLFNAPGFAATFIQNRILSRVRPPLPQQLRIFYIGGYWRGRNDMVAQMLEGLRATGVHVVDLNTDDHPEALDTAGQPYDRGTSSPVWLVGRKLLPEILRFRPHIIVCNAGGLSFTSRVAAVLRFLGIRLLMIVLSDPEVYEPSTSKIARNFDVVYTFIGDYVKKYRQHGPQAYLMPMATNQHFFHPVPAREDYQCEVLVLGAVHPDRIEPVRALVEHFDTHVYGENWEKYGIHNRGFLFGDDTLSALSSARMAVIFSRTFSGFQGVKVGIFDFLAAGCLVVTEHTAELERYFVVGKEIVAFDSTPDMLEKIRYYLDHPEQAQAIQKAGRERVIQRFTWDKVWPRILATVTPITSWPADPNWIREFFV